MAGKFEGKVAVITGGGRGIGRATSLLLAAEGAKVVVNDLGSEVRGGGADPSIAEEVAAQIERLGGEAIANGADAASFEGSKSIVDDAISKFGRIDVLINGAGILRRGLINEMPESTWDNVIRVNLKSVYAMVRHAAPHMMAQRSGAILSITSPSGYGHYGMSAYATSKEGLVAFTRSIARELGEYGIRCNAIRPCATTRMFLDEIADDMKYVVGELGVSPIGGQWFPGMNGEEPECSTENVAAVLAWLSLPATNALNGRVLYIAGGHLALCAEPELIRSRFNREGWSLSSLLSESVVTHFTYDQRNHFAPKAGRNPGARPAR
jgi:NAD(P)-dependent dehydrogenase (short-subunit alcohol dehydrogenase family)